MSKSQESQAFSRELEIYEICVKGHLHDRWVAWFEWMTISREVDGTTTLCGPLPDQTALHSVLLKIRNMNLKLLSVRQVEKTPDDKTNQVSK